jgi:hypothetical protein
VREPLQCRLDADGLRSQGERYRALGRHATAVERGPGRLAVRFDATVPVALLHEAVAVERECCPFFDLRADTGERALVVTVSDAEHDPALDAIRHALGLQAPGTGAPAGTPRR